MTNWTWPLKRQSVLGCSVRCGKKPHQQRNFGLKSAGIGAAMGQKLANRAPKTARRLVRRGLDDLLANPWRGKLYLVVQGPNEKPRPSCEGRGLSFNRHLPEGGGWGQGKTWSDPGFRVLESRENRGLSPISSLSVNGACSTFSSVLTWLDRRLCSRLMSTAISAGSGLAIAVSFLLFLP